MSETPLENHAVDIITAVMALLIILAILTSLMRRFGNLDFLPSWQFGAIPTIIMIIFIILDVLLVGFIAFTMRRYAELVNPKQAQAAPAKTLNPAAEIQESWKTIEASLESQNPSDWNMAVLRADALLDATLRDMGHTGDTMADRLKTVDPNQLRSIDHVWSAHRLRNAIAHNPTDQHTRETVIQAIHAYREAFRELGFMTESVGVPENIPFEDTPPHQISFDQKL